MHPASELRCTKSRKLAEKKIVLGVTGSIAAVETVKLARELIRHGADVYPVLTEAAQKIIHPYSLEFATGHEPVTEIDGKVQHVAFCGDVEDRADLLLIAPSTANTISKIAYGIDDTTVTTFATTAIGSKIPVIIVPAMHGSMYNHVIVLENIEKLKKIGIHIIEPDIEEHKAKMPNMAHIVSYVIRLLGKRDLKDKKVLVIAGSTAEAIDDVRVITNQSTGRTGLELALSVFERGGEVELWMGRCQVPLPDFVPVKRFASADELLAMTQKINHDIVLMPAAVSDYTIDKKEGKIPSGSKNLTLDLVPTPKIIQKIQETGTCFMVGFKAEAKLGSEELVKKAKKRMSELDLDMIVANDISETTALENHVFILDKSGQNEEISGGKGMIAESILDRVVSLC
ncbi:MAG: bifunctional phosphopantothenoylcysteine decarboxylase/phosphopantothenate--cysteine ligase CoaBC [Thermoplasmata archaeon]|nr:MAG: bifunctional phosphopantothenoylcysteine decarboxylase/phosphopantothenate--cysteine ligase CoaBC [Thermoplasmata archaeon]